MSFIGQPIVKLIADNLVRITGVQLDNDLFTTGLISLFENTAAVAPPPDIRLPDDFKPRDYDLPDAAAKVSLQDSVECWFVYTSPGAVLAPIQVVKTGTTPLDFLITLTDTAPAPIINDPPLPPDPPTLTGPLEIYIKFH